MKMTVAVFFSDLDANFDNITPSFSNILCQKKVMSKNACKTRAGVMENLIRHVRTAMGTSESSYENDEGLPKIPGEGQGKGDSMANWTLIFSVILEAHRNLCHGIELVCALGDLINRRTNDQYVDDADGWSTAPETRDK